MDRASVLPARLPNLLINGSTGIAVGMATSIPPHNMREVAAALKAYASDPENCSLDDVLAVMPAPDFPTGGEIVFPEGGFREMYRTGRGGVTLRGVTSIETVKTGSGARGSTREAVVISPSAPDEQRAVRANRRPRELARHRGRRTCATSRTRTACAS